ncbi:MAG: hypothetical protein LUI14_06770 [Lachnospiraceae bacterium]|nr:hypothetical protein [Lachnospiraceae bacterium]
MKEFNTTGICFPDKHYMVDTSDRIRTIIADLIEKTNILQSTEPDSMEKPPPFPD